MFAPFIPVLSGSTIPGQPSPFLDPPDLEFPTKFAKPGNIVLYRQRVKLLDILTLQESEPNENRYNKVSAQYDEARQER